MPPPLKRIIVDRPLKIILDREGRADPILSEPFKEGDDVAQCPSCGSYMLWQSWLDLGSQCACKYKADMGARFRVRQADGPTRLVLRRRIRLEEVRNGVGLALNGNTGPLLSLLSRLRVIAVDRWRRAVAAFGTGTPDDPIDMLRRRWIWLGVLFVLLFAVTRSCSQG
jgi:hypothetical protein